MRRILQTLVLVTVILLLLTNLAAAKAKKNILKTLAKDGRFTTLVAAIKITETEQAFSEGSWTLFAPTDAAFAELGLNAGNIGSQLTLSQTVDLLLYQAMDNAMTSAEAKSMLGDVTMSNGWLAGLKWYDGSLWVNDDSRVTDPDILAANGVIHVVDRVITPPWPRNEEETEIPLMASIEEAKLLQAEEIAAAEEEADDEEAATEEVAAEEVPAEEAATEEAGEEEVDADETDEESTTEAVTIPAGSMLDVMIKDGRFTTYLEAVGALDLVLPYSEGEWTIFAPTDTAFAAQGIDASNIATEYSVGELADLLLYHAMDEEITVDKAKTMLGDVTMRNDQIAGLKFFEDLLWVNDNARVIGPNIGASNGIIHAVDAIIERPWPRVESEEPELEAASLSGDTP